MQVGNEKNDKLTISKQRFFFHFNTAKSLSFLTSDHENINKNC